MRKFRGSYQELQDMVLMTGVMGEWIDMGNHKQYREDNGAILNWWESTKTITMQGKHSATVKLDNALSDYMKARMNEQKVRVNEQLQIRESQKSITPQHIHLLKKI